MERIARVLIRFRVLVLLTALAVTVLAAMSVPLLFADDDVMQFLPGDNREVRLFRSVNERFKSLDVAIIGLESEDLFTVERLRKVRQLTRRIAWIDGVLEVLSFTEVPDPKPSPFGLVVEPLVDRLPENDAEVDALKRRVLSNGNAVGNLISADGRAAMVLCFFGDKRSLIDVAADIKKAASAGWPDGQIYFGGAPFIRLHVAGGTKEDLVRLTPVVVIAVMLVTFILFPRPLGVLLALGAIGISLTWLMGLLAVRGKGITVVGSSLPTLLVAIGGAYGIHILARYFGGKATTVNERVVEAYREVGLPVAASAVTTCAGFLSFLAMDVEPMREFGAFAALGVGFAGIIALTVIPAALSFSRKVPTSLGAELLAAPLGRLGKWAAGHRALAIGTAAALTGAGIFGVFQIAPDATLKTFFREGSEPDRANKFLERHFGGSVYLQIYFEGDMRDPSVLAEFRKIVEFAKGMDEVVEVSSIVDPLIMMSESMGGKADLPSSRERIRSLYPFLEGNTAIDQIISPQKDSGLVQIRLREISPKEVNGVVDELRRFIEDEIPKSVRNIDLESLSEHEREMRIGQIRESVARRVVRLAVIYGGVSFSEDKSMSVANLLRDGSPSGKVESITDLQKAIAKVIAEHVSGDASPLEGPDDDSEPDATLEWNRRADLVMGELAALADARPDSNRIKAALESALPLAARRDPEGIDLTSKAVANGFSMAVSSISARSLARPVLHAAGVNDPGDDLLNRVAVALTYLDATKYGFPDSSGKGNQISAQVTGQPVINIAFCDSTIRNQLRSMVVTFVVLALFLTVFFKSITSALKALCPSVFTISAAVGIMGIAAIPIDLTTSMIAAIALGIGVDYAIHFLWRRRRYGESLEDTSSYVGPSIASNAVQVAIGFAVLALSDMIPMRRFGLLVAMTMILSAMATFVLLPALKAEGKEPIPSRYPQDQKT